MTVCNIDNCAGCMLCIEVCKKGAIHIEDNLNAYNAIIDTEKCVNCNACHKKCPQNNVPEKKEPIIWYQGWNRDEHVRAKSPSGGIGMALACQFIKEGGYVCSCMFKNGEFCFDITNDIEAVLNFGGSKYVKSNPIGIYSKILELLMSGEKVLFIGLPCQVAAVKNYVGDKFEHSLFLVDLICHGTPSPKLLERFLKQYSKSLNTITDIKFRIKAKMQIVTDNQGIVCTGVSDKYTIGFLKGLTYTNNCYECNYASQSRVSDITIGDSWGSEIDIIETKKGLSLMLVQTDKGKNLLERADVALFDVDKYKAMDNNGQLVEPMKRPKSRESFFKEMSSNNFNSQIFIRYKKECLKQDMKLILVKMGLAH